MPWHALAAASIVRLRAWRPRRRGAGAVQREPPAAVLDNARVRVYRTTAGSSPASTHGPARRDRARRCARRRRPGRRLGGGRRGASRRRRHERRPSSSSSRGARPAPPSQSAGRSKPGDAPFTGMSFNRSSRTIACRVFARAWRSGRAKASTRTAPTRRRAPVRRRDRGHRRRQDGREPLEARRRRVRRSRGSSHSARNVGGAVDVVLVALKPVASGTG